MSEDRGSAGGTIVALLLGAVVGAAAGLLLAPHAGRETRRRLRKWVEEVEEDLKEGGLNILEKGKEAVQEKVEAVKEKIEETFRGPSHGRGH